MGLSLEAPCPCRLSSRVWVAGPGSHSVNTAEPGSPAGSLQPRPVGRRLRWGLHSHCPWPGGRALGCCQGQVTSAALLSDVRTKEWRGMGGGGFQEGGAACDTVWAGWRELRPRMRAQLA